MPTLLPILPKVPPVRVLTLLFAENRVKFTHAVETAPDWHLLGLQKGQFYYQLGQEEPGACYPGEFILVPPGVSLARVALKTLDFYFVRFQWDVEFPLAWGGKRTIREVARLDSTLAHLRKLRDRPDHRPDDPWVEHFVRDLLYQSAGEAAAIAAKPKVPDRFMFRLAEEMRRTLTTEVTLEEIARKNWITPFELSRRFRVAFGVPPSLYRTRLRIQRAQTLLLETTWTTDRIAEACGFENAFYFSRVFTRQTGRSPRSFRRDHGV